MSDNMVGLATKSQRPNLHYELKNPATGAIYACPEKGWRYDRATMAAKIAEGRVLWPAQPDGRPRHKKFLSEIRSQFTGVSSLLDVPNTLEGTRETRDLFGEVVFDFPKPMELTREVVTQGTAPSSGDVVLDFFSGSGTAAHAVLDLNKQDGGNRTFIMVQLPEPCDLDSVAFKAGYKNIAEIGKERIRRVIKKLNDEDATSTARETQSPALFSTPEGEAARLAYATGGAPIPPKPDRGFKVFKLDSSNIKTWDPNFNKLEHTLLSATEKMKPDRTEADVIYEVLLKYGLDLTLPIEKRTIADRTVYIIGGGTLVVCLGMNMTLKIVEKIAELKDEFKPESPPGMRIVFKDNGFASDELKTNAVQILKPRGIEDVRAL